VKALWTSTHKNLLNVSHEYFITMLYDRQKEIPGNFTLKLLQLMIFNKSYLIQAINSERRQILMKKGHCERLMVRAKSKLGRINPFPATKVLRSTLITEKRERKKINP
jgi:hypothetical protein